MHFPEKLRSSLVKPPIDKLWYRGAWKEKLLTKSAAVVGSRRISRYGRHVVEEIVTRLVAADYTIISGLMYGVDQWAHRVALDHGGKVVAVIGYGITNKNEETAWKMEQEVEDSGGLVISEYAGDSVSQTWMFPQRNRIVAALADIVIVVEAGLKSGSLITARIAHKMGKTVYAVPGSLFSPTSVGTNWLIEHTKAHILTLDTLTTLTGIEKSRNEALIVRHLNADEREIYTCMRVEGPQTANEVARSLGLSAREVVANLVQMEMKGVVTEDRGVWMTL